MVLRVSWQLPLLLWIPVFLFGGMDLMSLPLRAVVEGAFHLPEVG